MAHFSSVYRLKNEIYQKNRNKDNRNEENEVKPFPMIYKVSEKRDTSEKCKYF